MAKIKKKNKSAVLGKAEPANIDIEEEEKLIKQQQNELRLIADRKQREEEAAVEKNRLVFIDFIGQHQSRFDQDTSTSEIADAIYTRTLQEALDKLKAALDWDIYLGCSHLPNVQNERDVSTYISQWSEESDLKDEPSVISNITIHISDFENLLQKLEAEQCAAQGADNLNRSLILAGQLLSLIQAFQLKADHITQDMLQHSDSFGVESTDNFLISTNFPSMSGSFKFGLWGNITHDIRCNMIDFPDLEISCSVPKLLNMEDVAIRVIYMDHYNVASSYANSSGKQLIVIGGIVSIDLLKMPANATRALNWTVRQILMPSCNLKRVSFPLSSMISHTDGDAVISAADDVSPAVLENNQLISFSYGISSGLFINKTARIAWWDEIQCQWSSDGISNVTIDAETGLVKFQTINFKPTAILQDKFAEFPYQAWNIEYVSPNISILQIDGKATTIRIKVTKEGCLLESPSNSLTSKVFECPLPAALFLKRMAHVGLNFTTLQGDSIEGLMAKHNNNVVHCLDSIARTPKTHFASDTINSRLSLTKCTFKFIRVIATSQVEAIMAVTPIPVVPALSSSDIWKSLVYDSAHQLKDSTTTIAFTTKDPKITKDIEFKVTSGKLDDLSNNVLKLIYPRALDDDGIEVMVKTPDSLFSNHLFQLLKESRILGFNEL